MRSLKLTHIISAVLSVVFTMDFYAQEFTTHEVDSIMSISQSEAYTNPDATIELMTRIYEEERYPSKSRIDALMNIAHGYRSKRDYRKALEFSLEANEFSQDFNLDRYKIFSSLNIGMLYQELSIYDKSLEYLDASERMAYNYPFKDSIQLIIPNIYLVKGLIYKNDLNCDIASDYFNKAISSYETIEGKSSMANICIAYYNKGNCEIQLEAYDQALLSFEASLNYASQLEATSLIAFAKKGIAEVYNLTSEYRKAIEILNESLALNKRVGDRVLDAAIYQGLYENHLALSEWESYKTYRALYNTTQEALSSSERNSINASIENFYNEKDKKITSIKSGFKANIKIIIMAQIVIISLILIFNFRLIKSINALQKSINQIKGKLSL